MAERPAPREEAAVTMRSFDQCVRCGKPTAWGRSVCKECNPAGLPEPSRTQYHATVFITVLVILAGLAILAIAMH